MSNNLFRSTIAITIAIYTLGQNINNVNGNDFCTLEGMRKHAADACEVLMRHERNAEASQYDLPYQIIESEDFDENVAQPLPEHHHHGKHKHHHHFHHHDSNYKHIVKSRVHIRKHEFPNDGFLLVDQGLSKYLVSNTNLDILSYNVDSNDSADNTDVVFNLINSYDQNQHAHRHRAHHQPHRRHKRQPDQKHIEFCCRYPKSDICSINMC